MPRNRKRSASYDRTVFKAELPPEVRAYYLTLQKDPCCYCGGPGGTVEHLIPQAARLDWAWWTGACAPCNQARSKNGNGQRARPRTLLEMLTLRTREKETVVGKAAPQDVFRIGERVRGPFFEHGVICEFHSDGRGVWVQVYGDDGLPLDRWLCHGNLSLRRQDGSKPRLLLKARNRTVNGTVSPP